MQIMMHDQDRLAQIALLAKHLNDRLLGRSVDGRKGFIQEHDVRRLDQGPGQERSLLLATGQLTDLPILQIRNPDALECLDRSLAMLAPSPAKPTDLAIHPHEHHIQDRRWKIPVDTLSLRDIRDAMTLRSDRLSKDPDRPTDPRHQLQNRFDQRAFASTVGTDDPAQDPLGNRQIDLP